MRELSMDTSVQVSSRPLSGAEANAASGLGFTDQNGRDASLCVVRMLLAQSHVAAKLMVHAYLRGVGEGRVTT